MGLNVKLLGNRNFGFSLARNSPYTILIWLTFYVVMD
jgi:hypothetical protein